jgi:glycosyltransferase involved in cell wall biosynthesis
VTAPESRPMPPALRVGVDCRALVPAPTGIGVYTRGLLQEMARQAALSLTALAHRPLHPNAELAGTTIRVEHQAAPWGVVWQQLLLPRRLARGDLDLFWSPLMTLPLHSPIPAVVTVHDLTALLYPEMHRAKVRWSLLPFLRPSLEQARRVVTISRATADDVRFHFPQVAERLRVVYPGIDPVFRTADAAAIAATRTELGMPEGYLLSVGTLEPRKGLATLLDAWEALRAENPATPPLVIVGGYGWGSQQLLRRIEALGSHGLRYLARVPFDRLVQVYQAARAFIYPSIYEGFGLPVAEAMACGIPTIVCRTSSLPEIVGAAGIVVSPGEAGELAQALGRLLADSGLEASLRARGPLQAARFDPIRAGREMAEVFLEAVQ